MKESRDLGVIDAPVLVFGGPYGNREAMEALLTEGARRGIHTDRMICTGDVAAYCADTEATADLLRQTGIHVVRGNCEEALVVDSADCRCGFAAGSACAALARDWYEHARRSLSPDTRRWMADLPARLWLTLGARRLAVVHGAPSRVNKFVFPSAGDDTLRAELAALAADGVLAGHSGLPFARLVGDRLWHNAGAIGLPANDGTARVWFSILTPGTAGIAIEFHPLDYDYKNAAARMRAAGLVQGYDQALLDGLWPSQDILPDADAARRGQRLSPPTLFWPGRARHALRMANA